jgi:hypothetical protein
MLGSGGMPVTNDPCNSPAAFPTIGRRMRPTNCLLICPDEVRPLIESTRNSAVTATSYSPHQISGAVRGLGYRRTTVMTIRRPRVIGTLIWGSSSCSTSVEPASAELTSGGGLSECDGSLPGGGELEAGPGLAGEIRSLRARWGAYSIVFGFKDSGLSSSYRLLCENSWKKR